MQAKHAASCMAMGGQWRRNANFPLDTAVPSGYSKKSSLAAFQEEWMDLREPEEVLKSAGISYKLKRHSAPAFTSADAARERGVAISQIIKTMLCRAASGQVVVALLPGDRKLDLKRLSEVVRDKVKLMSREDIKKVTSLVVGAISPLSFVDSSAEIVADPRIFENEWVDVSSGDPSCGIELKSDDLKRLLRCKIAEISG